MNKDYDIYSLEWEYEDNLPEYLSDIDYDHLFQYSEVRGGVRMFPFITIYTNQSTGETKRIYLGA